MSESYEYAVMQGEFFDSLKRGYIDASIDADVRFRPKMVTNDTEGARSLLSTIKSMVTDCTSFDFSVAFITNGGITSLLSTLQDLRDRNIPGRILTTTYNNFNEPEALRKLLEFPNVELRVFQGDFHTKGYLFHHKGYSTIIIGSSNLTQKALQINKEWNVLLHSLPDGEMLQTTCAEFEALWSNPLTVPITAEWIQEYEHYRTIPDQPKAQTKPTFVAKGLVIGEEGEVPSATITPNAMQEGALKELAKIHSRGNSRALLISATGTGKTYLAALEVQQVRPKRVLFAAHRERILKASLKAFKRILGNSYTYEVYGAGSAIPEATCVFAMVTTLRRHLQEFSPDAFDYIIIDEAHHTGAAGYREIMDYFTPDFYLGMTATPNRTDGYDVFSQFNHTIAYRITLQDAMENDMLVPFHYFGIADLAIDDEVIDDPAMFARLTSDERVRHVTQKIEEYTIDKHNRKGLIFCSRNEEATTLSEMFNELGYLTTSLSGANSDEDRKNAISKLEHGELEYIFTVDIFNEGIDIPAINQIIMLRRTESAIVFVQQLGRGLRKADDKEFTLVLDFIGNYQKNFLVPIALSGDHTYNKDGLRRFVKEGYATIPGCSTISFDRISEARVLRAIDGGRFSEARLLRDEYLILKRELGHIPSLLEFDANQAIDPLLIIAKFGSYHEFLSKYEADYHVEFTQAQCSILKFVSQQLGNGKRLEDLLLLKRLVESGPTEQERFARYVADGWGKRPSQEVVQSVFNVLSGAVAGSEELQLITRTNNGFALSPMLSNALADEEFARQFVDVLDFGISRHDQFFAKRYKDTNFVLYAKYTYEDACKLLNWSKNINGQNIGGYKYDAPTNTFPVFINYEKAPDISDTIRYEDRFISERHLIAISKQPRYMDSPEILRLRAWPGNGMRTYLFVRKNKNDGDGGKEFYFLGEMYPTGQFRSFTLPNTDKAAVEIGYELDVPVRPDLYDYITGSLDEDAEEDSSLA